MRGIKITISTTNRTFITDKYLQEVGRIPMLTQAEEVELAEKTKAGDIKARNKLVSANLRFGISVAKTYSAEKYTIDDLIQIASIGLIKAAQNFDHTKGFKFISYAVWWVRQALIDSIHHSETVRRPVNQVALDRKYGRMLEDFVKKNERYPDETEISEILEIDVNKVKYGIGSPSYKSFDKPLNDDEGADSMYEIFQSDDTEFDDKLNSVSLSLELQRLIRKLDKRESKIIQLYFIENKTLSEISEELNLTRERIRQLKVIALKKMENTCPKHIKEYV